MVVSGQGLEGLEERTGKERKEEDARGSVEEQDVARRVTL